LQWSAGTLTPLKSLLASRLHRCLERVLAIIPCSRRRQNEHQACMSSSYIVRYDSGSVYVRVPLMLEKWFLLGTLASRSADESPESPAIRGAAADGI
jgi:hypothetical protein